MPDGLRPEGARNPFNYSFDEWQRAKREEINPQDIKQVFRDAWNRSDGQKAFAGALSEYGYFLAKGDRRGFVAVDVNGDVYSVARYAGVTTKDVRFKLGTPDALPSVSEVSADLKGRVTAQVKGFIKDVKTKQAAERAPLDAKLCALRALHRSERKIMARDVSSALRRKSHTQDVSEQAKHPRPDPEHGRRNRGGLRPSLDR